MANTSNAKTVEAIFVSMAINDRSIISSELGRVGDTDSLVAVTHTRTAVGVLVADGIVAFNLGGVGNTDDLVTVTNAGTAVRIFVANRITSVDKAY